MAHVHSVVDDDEAQFDRLCLFVAVSSREEADHAVFSHADP